MLPEKGGASTFTLFMADRLERFGRPVSMDEWVDDVIAYLPMGVANYAGQRYQRQLIVDRHRHRKSSREQSDLLSGTVPAEGWHVDGFTLKDPSDLRRAVIYVMRLKIRDACKSPRSWLIAHGADIYSRHADNHPRVFSNGAMHYWTPEVREQADATVHEQSDVANRSTMERVWDNMTLEERGVLLRHLAAKIPVNRSASNRVSRMGHLRSLDKIVGDDPDQVIALLSRLLT